MNRFFLDKNQIVGNKVLFPLDISHQIRHVLRLDKGDQVAVLDNSGFVYQVKLELTPNQSSVQGIIMDSKIEQSEPVVKLALCFGLTSRDKVEWILQKATEIGVSEFFPFVSSRTLVQSTSLSDKKQLRWQRIIREASEQSHRGCLPNLKPPMDYKDCVLSLVTRFDKCLLAWEKASPLAEYHRQLDKNARESSIGLFIGPEGGFSEEEVDFAQSKGCEVVSLGARILRMETAAIVLPAIILYQVEDL